MNLFNKNNIFLLLSKKLFRFYIKRNSRCTYCDSHLPFIFFLNNYTIYKNNKNIFIYSNQNSLLLLIINFFFLCFSKLPY